MRGDIHSLFRQLVVLYNNKLELLKKISANETQLRYYLQSDKIHEVSDLIQSDNDLFANIDAVEFYIQSAVANICRISGIEKADFDIFFLKQPDEPLPEFKRLKEQTKKHIAELIKERNNLIINMEKKLAGIKVDIETLRLIQNITIDKIH